MLQATGPASVRRRVLRVEGPGAQGWRSDWLAVEEPLEVRLHPPGHEGIPVTVTMRTPGHDLELAAGLLFSEGLLRHPSQVARIAHCSGPGGGAQSLPNAVGVFLREELPWDELSRLLTAPTLRAASCGLCGRPSLEQLPSLDGLPFPSPAGPHPPCPADGPDRPALQDSWQLPPDLVSRLPDQLRGCQPVFSRTGGLHAAGLFDAGGNLLVAREDVGRHNAVDKVIGHAFLQGWVPLHRHVLVVSGRISYEIVQKAARAGIPVVVAVSAPTSLACRAAEQLGMTLVGFVRGNTFNVYTGAHRLARPASGRNGHPSP